MINVVVTQNVISHGLPGNPDDCPLALAIERVVGMPVSVGENIATLWDASKTVRIGFYHLPEKAVEFRRRFDSGQKVKPFNFVLKNKIMKSRRLTDASQAV